MMLSYLVFDLIAFSMDGEAFNLLHAMHSNFLIMTSLTLYFFEAAASSALAFALFSLTPTNLASDLAILNFLYGSSVASTSSSAISGTSTTFLTARVSCLATRPRTPSPLFAFFTSSAEASPFFGLLWRRGNRIKRFLYSCRRSTFSFRDSSERFWRRGSTAMPIVCASLRGIPAAYAHHR
jgi:hypothetical protein